MIGRREVCAAGVGFFGLSLSSPAQACRELQTQFRPSANEQINALKARLLGQSSELRLVISEDVSESLEKFVSYIKESEPLEIRVHSSRVYSDGDSSAYLVNFRLEAANIIMMRCGKDAQNNHAILGFRSGALVSFAQMTVFDSRERVRIDA